MRPRWTRGRRPVVRGAALGLPLVLLVLAVGCVGDVALLYTSSPSVAGVRSPLKFVAGGNYASANAEGFGTLTFPNAAQTSFALTVNAADGVYGTYLLDLVELLAQSNTTTGWHLHLDVVRALAGTGINAAWLFGCTVAPTGVPDTGTALAAGTDAAGDPYAVFAPTCPGTATAIALTATGTGGSVAVGGLRYGTTELYLSIGLAITAAGATTTTAATVVLTATSP